MKVKDRLDALIALADDEIRQAAGRYFARAIAAGFQGYPQVAFDAWSAMIEYHRAKCVLYRYGDTTVRGRFWAQTEAEIQELAKLFRAGEMDHASPRR